MAKRKIRITDNDPLESKTDDILSTFSTAQQSNKSASQPAKKSSGQKSVKLKKATYQLDEAVLERLDRAYLQMSLDRGKQNTPYKEVLVETAIANFLEQLEDNQKLVDDALARHESRTKSGGF